VFYKGRKIPRTVLVIVIAIRTLWHAISSFVRVFVGGNMPSTHLYIYFKKKCIFRDP